MKRKITITEGSRTVTIEDDGETPLDQIMKGAQAPAEPQPIVITSPYRFTPAFPCSPVWVTGSHCPWCGTHWPSPWFGVNPPCSCSTEPWRITFTSTTTSTIAE